MRTLTTQETEMVSGGVIDDGTSSTQVFAPSIPQSNPEDLLDSVWYETQMLYKFTARA